MVGAFLRLATGRPCKIFNGSGQEMAREYWRRQARVRVRPGRCRLLPGRPLKVIWPGMFTREPHGLGDSESSRAGVSDNYTPVVRALRVKLQGERADKRQAALQQIR